jgi:hypothetical protein
VVPKTLEDGVADTGCNCIPSTTYKYEYNPSLQ